MRNGTEVFLCILYLCLLLITEGLGSCSIDDCFVGKDSMKSISTCEKVNQILLCMQEKKRYCKGDINFHAAWTKMDRSKSGCTNEPEANSEAPEASTEVSPPNEEPAKPSYSLCTMHGGVHVKTWDNKYQSCRKTGALPLILSPAFDIQVTISPHHHSPNFYSISTSTIRLRKGNSNMKNSLEINSSSSIETQMRMTLRNHKTLFSYNVTKLGKARERAVLYIPHINTTVIIRKQSSLLGFTVHMPNNVLSRFEETRLGVCFSDFPCQSESSSDDFDSTEELKLCVDKNLEGPFTAWCAADLKNLRSPETLLSAIAAQEDLLSFDPNILNKIEAEPHSSSQTLRPLAIVTCLGVLVSWYCLMC